MHTLMREEAIARISSLFAAASTAAALAACGGGAEAPAPALATAPVPTPAPVPAQSPGLGDLSSIVLPTTYAAGSSQEEAYAALDTARQQGGFGTLAQNADLDQEAQSQADFIAANYLIGSALGGKTFDTPLLTALQPDGSETGHVQLATLPDQSYFTGYLPSDRATHFGYPSTDVAESATFGNWNGEGGVACIANLLTSPSHRELLLDPRLRDVGIGLQSVPYDESGTISATDCYVATGAQSYSYTAGGQATAPYGWMGTYPPNGSVAASTGDEHGHGFAPSLTVDSRLDLSVNSFTITDSSGQLVPTTLNLDAIAGTSFNNWAFATPNEILTANATYTVVFKGVADGQAITKVWTFTTPAN